MTERETIPNHKNWKQELYVINRTVKIRNFITEVDESRYQDIHPLAKVDDMFLVGEDMVLSLGRGQEELNMVVLIPKTESRSAEKEVTINSVMADRVNNPDLVDQLITNFNKKSSNNIKRLKLKLEVFSFKTNKLLMVGYSNPICDSSSKEHGILDFTEINVKSCCGRGGRKIFMISQGLLAQDVLPRFQLFDKTGNRLEDLEHLLSQPSSDITILKEMIIFIAPEQKNIEQIFSNSWEIKLLGQRTSDNMESSTKFSFQYFPHDFYDPCIFCSVKPDGVSSLSSCLPSPISPAKPGIRKRKMEDSVEESKDNKKLVRSVSVPVSMPSLTPLSPGLSSSPTLPPPASDRRPGVSTTLPLRAVAAPACPPVRATTSAKAVNLLRLEPVSPGPSVYTSPQADPPHCRPSPQVSPVSVIKYHSAEAGPARTNYTVSETSMKASLKTLHNIFRATNGFKNSKKTPSPPVPVSSLTDLIISPGNINSLLYTHPQFTTSRSVSDPGPGPGHRETSSKSELRGGPTSQSWHSPMPPLINIEEEPRPPLIKIEDED